MHVCDCVNATVHVEGRVALVLCIPHSMFIN